MARIHLKTKLVLAITLMVMALVAVLSSIYLSHLVRQRVEEVYQSAQFVGHEVFHATRQALEVDLSSTKADLSDPAGLRAAIEEVLTTDPGLNSLLQSIVGYSPTIYDVAIVDPRGRALLHTDADKTGKLVPERDDFAVVRNGSIRQQVGMVFGPARVFEIRIPLERDGQPFGAIRVGISTVFLKNTLQPQLTSAVLFSGLAILVSLALAAGLSNLALKPLEAINRRLDLLTAGQPVPEKESARSDEYGVVTNKIDRLGQQVRDVKEVFSALKENLDQIMANLEDGLMLFTRDWRAVLVSAAVERFLGQPRHQMLGHDVREIFDENTRLGRIVRDAFQLRQDVGVCEVDTEEGRRVQVSVDFIEENGERIGALITLRDAESVRRIEDEIELSRRLAAIGRLTSGVAHEVKNPINAIVVHLEVLRQKLHAVDPDTQRHMDVIGAEIQRLDRVVQTLVDFTRPVELRLADHDLRRIVDDVLMLAAPEAERLGVAIERNLAGGPLPVKVDADLLKQAVLNIVINGVQAMPRGGSLTVSVGRHDPEAWIEVRDQGGGIPPDIRDKIFNLYFTTKKAGSGIGLAMTYRVMQLHNGSVEFESRDGEGTTFRLHLPLAAAHEQPPAELAAQP
ncbi:MAG TPA: ATP-binding protein [Terriglobales bacterium]|nr:ATP-binding protein [Terriglobales bacterium]